MCSDCDCNIRVVQVAGGGGGLATVATTSGIQGNGAAGTPVKENFDGLPAGTGVINGVVVSTSNQPDGATVTPGAIVSAACEQVQDCVAPAISQFATYNDVGDAFTLKGVDALSDVDTSTTAPTSGQALVWNGANWVPGSILSTCEQVQDCMSAALPFATYDDAGNSFSLNGINAHSDVDTATTAPVAGQVLQWDGTNWVPATSASGGAPDIQMVTTASSTTVSPLPTVNTAGIAPTNMSYTNPFAGASAKLLITFKFGEMRVRFPDEIHNCAMRGNCRVNGVTQNPPADHDRRWSVTALTGGVFEITTATKDFDYTMTLAAGATVTLQLDYDYDINVAPSAGNNGRVLCEPATIRVVAWKV